MVLATLTTASIIHHIRKINLKASIIEKYMDQAVTQG